LIDTIAMIGSPATRCAVASWGGPGCGCLAVAPAEKSIKPTAAARATATGDVERRCITADCALGNLFVMPFSREMPVSDCADQIGSLGYSLTLLSAQGTTKFRMGHNSGKKVGSRLSPIPL
jgi:hypothetical protein